MVDPIPQPNVITLGEFRFDRATGELSRNGSTRRLRPQASAVLDLLVERSGEMVSREEFRQAIWPDATVDYDLSLNVCIAQVRDALDDQADCPRYVETLPRRGYRLVVDVPGKASVPAGPPRLTFSSALALAVLTVAVASAISLAVFFSTRGGSAQAAPLVADHHRMVVLPFRSIPENPEMRYLEEGLAEELITALASVGSDRLAVVARTSSFSLASKGLDSVGIGTQLEADSVLEGAIRRVGDRNFRVTVRLLDVQSSTYSWSDVIELRGDALLGVDSLVLAGLVETLEEQLSGGAAVPTTAPSSNVAERETLLRARFLIARFDRDEASKATELLSQTLDAIPDSPELWVELARARLQLGEIGAAEQALHRARTLDPEVGNLETTAGFVALYGRNDPWLAEEHFALAVARRPGLAEARRGYANALVAVNDAPAAVEHASLALELDPVSSTMRGDVGWIYYYASDFTRAREVCRSTLELVPTSASAVECVLLAAAMSNTLGEEKELLADLLSSLGVPAADVETLLVAVDNGSPSDLWQYLLTDSIRPAIEGGTWPARLLALLGQHAEAAEELIELSRSSPGALLFAAADPVFRETSREPSFQTALGKR